MKKIQLLVFCNLFFCCVISNAADSYDSKTGYLTIPQVKVGDALYQNVIISFVDAKVSSNSVLVPDTYDTYNSNTNQLTIPVVKVGSAIYYNAVVSVVDVVNRLSLTSPCLISTGCSKVGTPEVKGVLPGNGRISVMFNFMGGKLTQLLGSPTAYVPATSYVAVCTSSDGLQSASSLTSSEYRANQGNLTNPLVVSGLTNGKSYTCTVTASASNALPVTSIASGNVIPNLGTANASGVLNTAENTSHILNYPSYDSYCNYTNESALSLETPAQVTYYNTKGVWSTGTSASSLTCTSTTRTVTGNALPDYVASKFFTNGLTGYTNPPYMSGVPNLIGQVAVSKTVPLSGTISSAYVQGSAGFDTSACYSYTSNVEPSNFGNTKWAVGGSVSTSNAVRCEWVTYFSYLNNSVKVEPTTAETYTNSGITYKVAGKNLYQDVGLDPSNSHTQPSGGPPGSPSSLKYGYYHLHGMPEGYIARLGKGNKTMTLIGFAVDGFPIYARYGYTNLNNISSGVTVMKSNYRIRSVAELAAAGYSGRPSASIAPYGSFEQDWVFDASGTTTPVGDLDACNGRFSVTPESPNIAVYHYYITDSYPYVPRCVFGTPATWANDHSVN